MLVGEFRRLLNTTKTTKDYVISQTATMPMIWAINYQRSFNSSGSIPMHTYQGTAFINFGVPQPCGGGGNTTSAPNSYLSPNHDFWLSWDLDSGKTSITFTMSALATGWIGIGIGSTATMTNTDMYIGWIEANGTVTFSDAWSTGHSVALPDTSQGGRYDATNITGSAVCRPVTLRSQRTQKKARKSAR